jgi:uncharacterized tellurite resistance protein B-like protein
MLDALRSLFLSAAEEPADPDGGSPPSREIRLAACALLLELAKADDQFTEDERNHIVAAVQRQWDLDSQEADELIRRAEQKRATAVDLWEFTNLIKEHYSLGQKMALAETMWGVVYSDGELASREGTLMRKISNLLDLKPGYLSEARKRVDDEPGGP